MNPELTPSPHSLVLDAALAFHVAGCSVVPVANDGSKRSIVAWKKYQEERASAEQISQWFNGTEYGVAVICGDVSGGLELLELEGRAVASGLLAEVREIAYNSGLGHIWDVIANGYVEQTPSGGIHFLYRIADAPVPGNTKFASRPGENGAVDCLAESRGQGGYVIVAPSGTSGTAVHASGKPWVMLRGNPATIPMLSWDERCAIVDCFKALDAMPSAETVIEAISPKSEHQGLTPGDDYNARASWDEILLPLGWRKVFSANGVIYWRRPGKDSTGGISATTGRNDGDNLYVFSTSTVFDAEKPYSKWAALTHLEFGGDFKASARHLRTMGYGAISAVPDMPVAPSSPPAPTPSQVPSHEISHQISTADEMAPAKSREEVEFEYQLQQARIRARVKQALEIEEATPEIDESVYEDSSWKPVDFTPFLDGTHQEVKPELMARSDGNFLLYAGKVHSFYGESESGKSWVAQYAAAEQLKLDKKVIYIDFESDPADLHKRLTLLGVERYQISKNWVYLKPESARDIFDPYWKALLEPGASLVVIDGVTEALTMWGGETKDNDSITKWMREFPRKIAAESGGAVVLIDHVTKNAETRGRFQIGGQSKLATIDGAAFLLEPLQALAPGRVGQLTMRVTKDRPGQVRAFSGFYRKSDRTQEASVITIDATNPRAITFDVGKPMEEEEIARQREDRLSEEIMTYIAGNPNCSKNMVTKGVTGNAATIGQRIHVLMEKGFIDDLSENHRPRLAISEAGAEQFDLVFQPVMGDVAV